MAVPAHDERDFAFAGVLSCLCYEVAKRICVYREVWASRKAGSRSP
jgi:hypothetical protein